MKTGEQVEIDLVVDEMAYTPGQLVGLQSRFIEAESVGFGLVVGLVPSGNERIHRWREEPILVVWSDGRLRQNLPSQLRHFGACDGPPGPGGETRDPGKVD